MKHIVWIMCLWLLASCSESREEAMLLRKNLTVYFFSLPTILL